jgi:hypothetical protein
VADAAVGLAKWGEDRSASVGTSCMEAVADDDSQDANRVRAPASRPSEHDHRPMGAPMRRPV